MRKVVLLAGLLAGLFIAQEVQAKSWSITSWESAIAVQEDSSFIVEERVTYRFEGDFSFVERHIPVTKGIAFDSPSVLDGLGNRLSDGVKATRNRSELRFRIAFSLSDTESTWVYRYRVLNGLGAFDDHDELYWNVTGNAWEVPIEKAIARVTLPADVAEEDFRARILVGELGTATDAGTFEVLDARTVELRGGAIPPATHFTIVLGWPKGVVTIQKLAPTVMAGERLATFLRRLFWLFPIAVFAVLYRRWRVHGRDALGRTTIVPQYEPPDKIEPAVLGVLIDERADLRDVTATIIDLAVRGYLVIHETERKGLLRSSKDYTFELKKSLELLATDPAIRPYERELLSSLFSSGTMVRIADLKNVFYQHLKSIKTKMYDEVVGHRYFVRNPEEVRLGYTITGLVIAGLSFFAIPVLQWLIIPLAATGILIVVFGQAMPKRTQTGTLAHEHAKGFRVYLHTAERFRVGAMQPETFERFLPYAMVFGVEKQWAQRFADIAHEPPNWYTSSAGWHAFSAVAFTDSLSQTMNATVASVLASSPSSSSGFGGGGFSGGGGGGGGGGAG